MIRRLSALLIMAALPGCPSKTPRTPDPEPPDDPAVITPDADAGAAPVLADATAPPLAAARVWLAPVAVSWPKDRNPAQFHALGGGAAWSAALAVSGDGSTPAGIARPTGGLDEAVVWRDGTMQPLKAPELAGEVRSAAHALSFDGKVVAGSAAGSETREVPVLWRDREPPHQLPLPRGGDTAVVHGLSRDGTIAIGCGGDACDEPVRWTGDHVAAIEGPRPFALAPHPVTTNGKIIAGTAAGQAARIEGLSVILKDPGSIAYAISDDGKLLVGQKGKKAVMWHGKKAVELGTLPGHDACHARALSADGGRIVGNCTTATGTSTAWVWDARKGMRSVAEALAAAKVPTIGWSLDVAFDVCSYGVTIVGRGKSPDADGEAWMAIVPRW